MVKYTMGLAETLYPAGHCGREERREFVKNQLKDELEMLLSKGGAIDNTGRVLAHKFDDLVTENLTYKQTELLIRRGIMKMKIHEARPLIPEGRRLRARVHIIAPGTDKRLQYHVGKAGALFFTVAGLDEDGKFRRFPISNDGEFVQAFSYHVEKVLRDEGMVQGYFLNRARFTNGIMKDIVASRGFGQSPTKF